MKRTKKDVSPEKRENRRRLLWPLIVIALFTIVRLVQGGGHSVESSVDDRQLGLSVDSHPAIFIPLEDVESIELVNDIGSWELLDGSSDDQYVFGICHTDSFGDAQVCAYLSVLSYIVLELDQETFIYNLSTAKQTEKDYDSLLEAMRE